MQDQMHTDQICCDNADCECAQIAYAADDHVLVTGGYDQAIRLWDCRSRSFDPIQTMKSFGDSVTSVAIADRHASDDKALLLQ